jgi:hypothetical protein
MEAQLRDKQKWYTDEEAYHAETAPPAQKLCFNLECEATGSDLLDELSGMGPVAQMADNSPQAEEAQSFGSESDSESKSVPEAKESDWTFESDKLKPISAKCKQMGGSNRSQPKGTANSGRGTKEKPAKTPITSGDSHRFSSNRRIPILLFEFLFACCTQLSNTAELQISSLEMQLAIYFLASWVKLHSVFSRTIITGFFLGLFFLECSYF